MDASRGPLSPTPSASTGGSSLHQLSFMRNGHTWQLRWEPGEESLLLDALAVMAQDPSYPLNASDEALVKQQMLTGKKSGPS